MTKLSSEQIKKLNEDQPEDYEKNKYFPIVFSMNFKNSLTHNQRLNLCDLKLTSLTRINILKDYTKKITIKNLNYNALNLVPPENNLNSIRNLYVAKSILKNWEIKEDDENESVKESKEENLSFNSEKNNSDEEKKNSYEEKKNSLSNSKNEYEKSEKYNSESNIISINNNTNSDMNSQYEENSNENISYNENQNKNLLLTESKSSKENNNSNNNNNEEIDFNGILNSIKEYCQNNCPENLKYIDEKFLFLLCREMEMPKDDLLELQNSPEAIQLLIDTYKEMIDENEKDNKYNNDNDKDKFIIEKTSPIDYDIINDFIENEIDSNKDKISPQIIPFSKNNKK